MENIKKYTMCLHSGNQYIIQQGIRKRRGKGTRDVIGMMRIIAEQTLEIDEELCVCFIGWQKAFDHVNWTKLMYILKRTGIDWRERRLISKLYMEQKVKVRLD